MDESSTGAPGRSRGRARGRAQPTPSSAMDESIPSMQAMRISPTGDGNGNGSNGSNGNGNGNGDATPAVRGRGGYYRPEDINTKPDNVIKIGTIGEEVTLLSNYFRLNTPTDLVVQNYHVDFAPNVEDSKLRRTMIYNLKSELFSDRPFIFDGMSNIKTLSQITEERNFVVANPADADQNVTITVRHTQEVPWGSPEMMRMFNTQMRKNLRYIGWVLMGRNYFDVKSKQTVEGHKIQLMPGVITAIAQHDGGLMIVVDSSTKFIRADTVLSLLLGIRKRIGAANWLDEAKREICGSIVMTSYNNMTYKVDDLDTAQTPQSLEFDKGGERMNLVKYYAQQYNLNIQQPNQPLIKCLPSQRDRRAGRDQPIYLVPELCQMTGLTDQMRSDFQLMRKIGDVSRLAPKDRVNNLNKFMNTVTTNAEVIKDMGDWKLNFDRNLVNIKGRVLPCEAIYMGDDVDANASKFNQKSGDFGREIRSKRLYNTCSISKWYILVTRRDEPIVNEFTQTLKRVCVPMGINLAQPRTDTLPDERTGTFVARCQAIGPPCEMIVVIVPNNNKERYDAIKKICYCENPIASQVVVARTLQKKQMLMSVCTKVAIQMAAKMGAEPWALKIPPKDIMVVGYDTYHDALTKGKSVGGFVCSLNGTLTSWHSRVAYHNTNEEMSANFANNLKEGIKRYFETNKSLPKRVVIYRDGVSDGQIPHVFDYELKQVREALKLFSAEEPPNLAFVIVTKRVNARFFLKVGGQNQLDNPIPGTIVDSEVTRLNRYDFYLISQSVRQGTVTPTMYNIIYDSTGFRVQHHQQLAYKLTHLYYNWQGTIRVPAPCQYAHKLAYLTGTSLHREPSNQLSDRLFYL